MLHKLKSTFIFIQNEVLLYLHEVLNWKCPTLLVLLQMNLQVFVTLANEFADFCC